MAIAIGAGSLVVAPTGDPVARSSLDSAELLDVDVDELAGAGALVAAGRLEPQPSQAPKPHPGEDP